MSKVKKEVSLGELIQGSNEHFEIMMGEKNLGYLMSLKNTLIDSYNTLRSAVIKLNYSIDAGDSKLEDVENDLKLFYVYMGRIEEKLQVIEQRIQKLQKI